MAQNQSLQAVGAKIRCRYGGFLQKEDYQTLAGCSSLSDFIATLAPFSFYQGITKLPPSTLSGKTLGIYLEQQYLADMASLFRFDLFLGSPLYRLVMLQITLEIVLSFARHYNRGLEFPRPQIPSFFEKRLDFDLDAFSHATQYAQIIPLFGGHPFQKALAANIPLGTAPVNIARLEQDLMQVHLQTIQEAFLQKKENSPLGEIFSLMIDLENIQKLLRCKQVFTTYSSGETPLFLAGGNYTRGQLKQWFSLSQKQLEQKLKATPYGEFLSSDLPWDFALEGLLYSRLKKIIRTTSHIPTMLFAYCLLSKHQKECLTVIARGIEYRMPQGDIMKLLAL